ASSDRLNIGRSHVGRTYRIDEDKMAGTYTVFRQTDSFDGWPGQEAVLIVSFRLKLLGDNGFGHRLFQRVCILTTPIWSGFRGFRVKLWMVDHDTKNYLGIYKWAGAEDARNYIRYLTRVLNFFSVPGSVHYKIYPTDFGQYLKERAANVVP